MNKERVHKIRELFEAAVHLEPAAREAFLEQQCGADADTKEFLGRMLAADSGPGVLLDSPIPFSAPEPPARREGEPVGAYRLLREIGSGGTATVYLATQDDGARRSVAVKILHWRGLSADGVRRFARERAILAGLDHPNIAKLLDGGTTEDGHPYFVMEFVDGIPIRQYCFERRLSLKERLGLFRQVCAAVQYAHQNLIVHGDLKPGNILVTVDGLVKLVDFGIAKPLASSPEFPETVTLTGMRPMTPDYASPEQITGGPISTATDVFSLGVILYELLTGSLPHAKASENPHAFIASVCHREPLRPSLAVGEQDRDLGRHLKGEVDNIVMRALEKEPARRYQSVEQLNDDIGRYLKGLPVLAQRDTLAYRSRKFLFRHRAAVGAATSVFVILVAGIVSTTISARTARLERVRAEQAQRQAEREAAEAREQRRTAERRLDSMSQMAQKFMSLYNTVRGEKTGDPIAAEIARETRDSVGLVLKEGVRDASLSAGLASTTASLSSYQSALAGRWQVPKFWNASETAPHEFLVTIDHERVHRGNSSLSVRSIIPDPKGAAVVAQTLRADGYRSRRVRVSAFLASRNLAAAAFLWLHVRTPNGEVAGTPVAGARAASISGTTAWTEYALAVVVPADATFLEFGVRLAGAGILWADDFTFQASDPMVPVNLGFQGLKKGQ